MKRYYSRWIEKNSWLLILTVVIPGFLFNDSSYRVARDSYLLVIFPILGYWLLNPDVLRQLARFRAVQLFAVFLAYSVSSIFWSIDGYATHVLVRCLGACVLLTLSYLVTRHHPEKLARIETAYLIGGISCLLLTIYKKGFRFSIDRFQDDAFGPFSHHVYISWLAATLLLLLLTKAARLSILQCVLFCFFVGYIMLSSGRSGLMIFMGGYLCMIFRQENRYREKQVILCVVIPALLLAALNPNALLNMVNKGASSRGAIFQVYLNKATDSVQHIVIGRGLNTDTDIHIKKTRIPHFHSLYLTLMYDGGVISLLLYLVMAGFIIVQGLRCPDPPPWLFITIGMSLGLTVDASEFFVWPSALMTCFIIPLFLTVFSAVHPSPSHDKAGTATTG